MFETLILANWVIVSVAGATQPAEHNAFTLRSIGLIVFELWQYVCKLNNCQCSRRRATCWGQRVDTEVDWPNSFWDMTKCLKRYSCKLKKQQCSRLSATCWAQRVHTQVDWPNSFWDMTKRLKPYSCKLNNCQCSRRSATCWAQRVDTPVDWPNSFEIWQNV